MANGSGNPQRWLSRLTHIIEIVSQYKAYRTCMHSTGKSTGNFFFSPELSPQEIEWTREVLLRTRNQVDPV